MHKSTAFTILRIFVTLLWRVTLIAFAAVALFCVGSAMVLSMIFNGPSVSARDALTLTLLESSSTQKIPAMFLEESQIAAICSGINAKTGASDPGLICVDATDDSIWAAHPEGIICQTLQTESFTAEIYLIRDAQTLALAPPDGQDKSAQGDYVITCSDSVQICTYAGFLPDGRLILSEDYYDLQSIQGMRVIGCGPVLIQDSSVNASLLESASGYSPRAALGQCADGTVIFVSTTGWSAQHIGATYRDMINIMVSCGAVNATLIHRDAQFSHRLTDTAPCPSEE